MNSLERKEARYLRRKKKREDKIIERSNKHASIDKAFTFSKAMYYADKCCNGVRWKKSTINFQLHEFTIIATTCHNIKNNTYKVNKTFKFKINERGKVRDIDAPYIKDRLIHKIISNEIIVPIYEPHLIYDNGASQKSKGFMFALNRLKYKLIKYLNKYNEGYVVLIDYSKFFENCSHEVIHNIHKKYIKDSYTIKVIEDYLFIDKGIALGIEIAQREAIMLPNILDHYIENNNGNIIRYMDDSIFICNDYNKCNNLLNKYIELASKYNIKINNKKTRIIDINNSFIFCKWKYIIINNKVIVIPIKSTINRQRRKLRKLIKNNININEINNIITCFNSYLNMLKHHKHFTFAYIEK